MKKNKQLEYYDTKAGDFYIYIGFGDVKSHLFVIDKRSSLEICDGEPYFHRKTPTLDVGSWMRVNER